ncbi:MAG: hypothetical protein CMJ40_04255 [Phycisphaerae bacterium]|nr:hypothetical protein [Phycisphaerae bacterium]|tara:strand:+ start:2494 stop:2898 length:405 start_codon:yes stop_codon:yes gene_type:complete
MTPSVQFESIVKAADSDSVVLHPPGNRYELHFSLEGSIDSKMVGNRIVGTAHATALKVHQAVGGGAFIEPLEGEPRIVAGRVIGRDEDGVVLVRSAIPLSVRVDQESDFDKCKLGEFINFHVESGMTFHPSSAG